MGLNLKVLHHLAGWSLVALVGLGLAWEMWLVPLRPGGSLLALKVLPLLVALAGIWQGRVYTFKWASLLVWLYFTEGVVRAWSESGLSRQLALLEIVLTLVFFAAVVLFVRQSGKAAQPHN